MIIQIPFFIRTRGLFLLQIQEQIRNNANLGMKKIIENTSQYNASASKSEEYLSLFYISIVNCLKTGY